MSSEAPQSEETPSGGVPTPQTPAVDTSAASPEAAAAATPEAPTAEAATAEAATETPQVPSTQTAPAADTATTSDASAGVESVAKSDELVAGQESGEGQAAATTEDSAQTTSRRRPRLKSAQNAQAIPSFAPTTPPVDSPRNEDQSPDAADSADSKPTAPAAPATPIDMPPDQNLDADLEAEIAAAMSMDSTSPEAETGNLQTNPEAATDEQTTEENIEPGTRMSGQVESIDQEHVFVELGFRSPGIIQIRQFESAKPPQVGQTLDVVVDRVDESDGLVVLSLPRGKRRVGGDWSAISRGQVVDCMVTKTNKGGLEVSVSSLRGFLPAGQVDLAYVSDLEQYVGQKLTVQITEVNPKKRNLVVSRRALLIEERKAQEQEVWESIEVGQTHSGQVKTLKDYGAFVDIGNVDGFLHIGEISWSRINHPSEVLTVGQSVDVKIISLDPEKKRIGLGMRQLAQNPWNLAEGKYPSGSTVSGKVTRTAQFGAFVELEAGVEGLIHISELDYSRVNRVTDVLQVGQDVEVKVLNVDTERKRISLSLKAMNPAPEPEEQPEVEQDDPASAEREIARQAARENLKGGMGGSSQGGLFGNPGDYK